MKASDIIVPTILLLAIFGVLFSKIKCSPPSLEKRMEFMGPGVAFLDEWSPEFEFEIASELETLMPNFHTRLVKREDGFLFRVLDLTPTKTRNIGDKVSIASFVYIRDETRQTVEQLVIASKT